MFTHRDRTLKDSGDELCREMNDTRRNDGVFNYAPWEADAGGISEKRVLATPSNNFIACLYGKTYQTAT